FNAAIHTATALLDEQVFDIVASVEALGAPEPRSVIPSAASCCLWVGCIPFADTLHNETFVSRIPILPALKDPIRIVGFPLFRSPLHRLCVNKIVCLGVG